MSRWTEIKYDVIVDDYDRAFVIAYSKSAKISAREVEQWCREHCAQDWKLILHRHHDMTPHYCLNIKADDIPLFVLAHDVYRSR